MISSRKKLISLFASATLVASGCTSGSKPNLPTLALPESWETPTTDVIGDPLGEWWGEFGDKGLSSLVRRVLESNGELLASERRLEKARLRAELASRDEKLIIRLSSELGWETISSMMHRKLPRDDIVRGVISYDFDVGGQLGAKRDIAYWQAEGSNAQQQRLRLSVVEDFLKNYWQLEFLNERLAMSRERMVSSERRLAIVRARYDSGAASKLEIVDAQQKLNNEQMEIDRVSGQVIKNRHALAVLLGVPPETKIEIPEQLSRNPLPPLSAGIPAKVIRHRPDVRAAEANLRLTLADVDAARADLYPKIELTSSVGTSSVSLQRFLANPLSSVGLALALPFVEWKSTKTKIRGSQAEFDATAIEFRNTVFKALKDVEDHLATGAELERHAAYLQKQLDTLRTAETLARRRYVAGATSLQSWLDSQQALQNFQETILQNRHERLTNRAELLVALGGVASGVKTTEAGSGSMTSNHAPSG